MKAITPISTTRVSDPLITARLLGQIRFDQTSLFRIQNQLSTGMRFMLPSEDAPAALRSISLQKLLERKEQVKTNLSTNQSFLSASDSALASVASMLSEIRGLAVSSVSAGSSAEAQAAAARQVEEAIRQLVDIGNQQFRGRYLFAGSMTSVRPFELFNGLIRYNGNSLTLESYADIDVLFATNTSGDEVFGALSAAVQGQMDLNPIVTENTLLSDLNGGRGITPGSIAIGNGTGNVVTIDISKAETVGDVVRLIESANLPGSRISAWVTPQGINVQLSSGNLTIREVAGGTTAHDLGILSELGTGTAPVVGRDLNPAMRLTTPVADLMGVRAQARLSWGHPDSAFFVEANQRGTEFNGYTVNLVGGGIAGSETVVYDEAAKSITVTIQEGVTTAALVVKAINNSPAAAHFTAKLPPGHQGAIGLTAMSGTTSGGTGVEFDQHSGIQVVNGGQTYTISFSTARTVEDILNILNGSDAGLIAEINAARNGINIRSRLSGGDFAIGENGGQTATQLGVRSFTLSTRLEDMNHGRGVARSEGDLPQPRQFTIRRKDGVEFTIDLNEAVSATGTLNPTGVNNALRFSAVQPGFEGNRLSVQIVDSGAGSTPKATLTGNLLTISADMSAGFTANDAITLIQNTPEVAAVIRAELDTMIEPGNDGSGNLAPTAPVTFSGGSSQVQTIEQLLDRINGHPANTEPGKVVARLAVYGNGIELVTDDLSGPGTLTVLADNSTAAQDLGLLGRLQPQSGATQPGTFASVAYDGPAANDAFVVSAVQVGEAGNNFRLQIVDNGGGPASVALVGNVLTFSADLASGFTAQDAVNLLAADPVLSQQFVAHLDTTAEPGNDGSGNLVATGPLAFSGGQSEVLRGTDAHLQETDGLFSALIRLRDALYEGDLQGAERAVEMLDRAAKQVTYVRADLGARQQGLDILKTRLDTEEVELKSALSQESEVDLVEAIINLIARQSALEASYQTLGHVARLSLIDFL